MEPITLDTHCQRLLAQPQQVPTLRERTCGDRAAESAEVLERLDTQRRREAEEIQAALARIEAGTYGRCEACHNPISVTRLNALPMARRWRNTAQICRRCATGSGEVGGNSKEHRAVVGSQHGA
jgi:RNA polymerase-binding transcription factor DksA